MKPRDLEEYPMLIGQTGPLKGQRWVLTKPILVGREATCEVDSASFPGVRESLLA